MVGWWCISAGRWRFWSAADGAARNPQGVGHPVQCPMHAGSAQPGARRGYGDDENTAREHTYGDVDGGQQLARREVWGAGGNELGQDRDVEDARLGVDEVGQGSLTPPGGQRVDTGHGRGGSGVCGADAEGVVDHAGGHPQQVGRTGPAEDLVHDVGRGHEGGHAERRQRAPDERARLDPQHHSPGAGASPTAAVRMMTVVSRPGVTTSSPTTRAKDHSAVLIVVSRTESGVADAAMCWLRADFGRGCADGAASFALPDMTSGMPVAITGISGSEENDWSVV